MSDENLITRKPGKRCETMNRPLLFLLTGIWWGVVSGCGGPLVGITVVDERTALENQVLGTYKELQQEVLLLASVRYIDPQGNLKPVPNLPPGKKEVIRAIQRSAFNKDDIDRLKAQGILGENNEGGLTVLDWKKVPDAERAFVENLVAEENADRAVIMRRVIETNETFTLQDLPRVRKLFAALNRDNARKGEFVQLESGEWIVKE
ncbi:MAG: DUF1318 domain-containing protein [Nitrospirae bacterium]|nr:MAG: DUF1318 domain-containing protein [Nitrospirota bacterium]